MTAEAQKLALIQMILSLQDSQLLNKIEQLLKSNGVKPNGVAEPDSSYPVKKRKAGFAKGMTLYIAPDFDETPPGFEEYMPESQ
ncbi:MAG TPA: hypothetical protein PK228_09410 [Saprospiraceae bacterium]|nr:hypothetical protein [Saprospiraceae bacterium]